MYFYGCPHSKDYDISRGLYQGPLFRDNYHMGSTDLNHMIFPSTETLLGTIYIVRILWVGSSLLGEMDAGSFHLMKGLFFTPMTLCENPKP